MKQVLQAGMRAVFGYYWGKMSVCKYKNAHNAAQVGWHQEDADLDKNIYFLK
jgi:hypothetical protein